MLWIAIRPDLCSDAVRLELTQLAMSITSQGAWHTNNTLLMDVSASLRLFGGVHGIQRHLQMLLRNSFAQSTAVQVSLSISAMGAWLLAQEVSDNASKRAMQHWRYALSSKRLVQFSDPLPISLLSVCRPYLRWFQGIGCNSMGQLRALPRAQLKIRTSTDVLQMLDQIEARAIWPYSNYQLPEHFLERRSLDEPVYDVDRLQTLLQPIVLRLCQWLQAQHWAVISWEVRLFHASRRHHRAPSRLRIGLSEPGWRIEHLSHLLGVRLQAWSLPGPVTDLMVLSQTVVVRQLHNQTLFVDTQTQQQDLRHTWDTLRARLGDEAVCHATPCHDYRPEKANQWQSSTSVHAIPNALKPLSTGEQHSPAWLLPAPQKLKTHDERPSWLGEPLRLLHGPYRVETGWWDQMPAQRDYFVATDNQARHYWIYRERTQTGAYWFLHGLFG